MLWVFLKLKRFAEVMHLTSKKGGRTLTQKSLLKKAQKGNEQAFIELLQPEKLKLYKMAYLYMKNETDALDIVQETVARAFASIHSVKEPMYFSTWLTKICINTALESIRKTSKIIYMEQPIAEIAEDLALEEKMDLLEAIEQLDEKYKTVIILKYYQDLPVKDIAELLNCPQGTVKTNIHRAIQQLKKHVLKGGGHYGEQY